MSQDTSRGYERPELTEYGTVESITQNDKIGSGEDQYSGITSLTGSVV